MGVEVINNCSCKRKQLVSYSPFLISLNPNASSELYPTLFIFDPHLGQDISLCSFPQDIQKYLICESLLLLPNNEDQRLVDHTDVLLRF
jgi:hypothetical protein